MVQQARAAAAGGGGGGGQGGMYQNEPADEESEQSESESSEDGHATLTGSVLNYTYQILQLLNSSHSLPYEKKFLEGDKFGKFDEFYLICQNFLVQVKN